MVRHRLRAYVWAPRERRRWVPCLYLVPLSVSTAAREAVAIGLGSPRPRPASFSFGCLPRPPADDSLSTSSGTSTTGHPFSANA